MSDRKSFIRLLCAILVGFATSSAVQAETGVLEKIRSSGSLTLGYRESSIPFSYLGAEQKPVGMSLDLCGAIADKLKSQLNLPNLKVNYVAVNASNRIPLIQNGTIDIECGSTTNTIDRQKQVAFSVATFASQTTWLTTKASGISDVKGLKDKIVVITQGSSHLPLGQQISKEDDMHFTIVQAKDHAESLLVLRTGRATGWLEDNILQAGLVAASPDPNVFKFLPEHYGTAEYYGLMLPKGDADFKTVIDGVIKEKMASGEFTTLYNKWFNSPIPPNGLNLSFEMSDALKARIASPSDSVAP
jgi:glutamate/aspartate transport system substrate-binding protein